MKSKCPHCGKVTEVPPEYFKRRCLCDNCGHEYVIGVVYVANNTFVNGSSNVLCPYCGTKNVLPWAAANKDVNCGSCGKTFHVHVFQPNPQNVSTPSERPSKLPWIIPLVIIAMASIVILLALAWKSPTIQRTVRSVFYSDEDCRLEIMAAISENDYVKAMEWARRVKDERIRRICISAIKDAEATDKALKELQQQMPTIY